MASRFMSGRSIAAVRVRADLARPVTRPLIVLLGGLVALSIARPAQAYIEIPYTMGRTINEAAWICTMQVEKVDKERNLIIYRKLVDLKGKFPQETIKHNIGENGFDPREWKNVMAWAEPGKIAVFFHNGGASETCIDGYWYQAYAAGEWWGMSHAEPYFNRTYCGKPEKLIPLVTAMLAGQEVLLPCMVDGDKMALHLRTARIQRLKASLKIQDYDAKRDFGGWGGEELRRIESMPGFTHLGTLGRTDPGSSGVALADFQSNGKPGFCLFGLGKVALVQNEGNNFSETPLPPTAGARAAAWADYNGDGKPDLLLATPAGPRLFTNQDKSFRDDSAAIPAAGYWHLTAAAWLDYDGDGQPDLLLADGFRGLRLLRNIATKEKLAAAAPPQLGKWHYFGPLDNANNRGFDLAYLPERGVDYKQTLPGKNGEAAVWRQKDFSDGQVNSLTLFKPENNENSVVYVHREIEAVAAVDLPISLGSDDTLTVWLNGKKLFSENVQRPAEPDQAKLTLKLKPGKNSLLLKICQGEGDWGFYFAAGQPSTATLPLFEDVSDQVGLGVRGVAGNLKGEHLLVADVDGDGRPDFLFDAGQGVLVLNTPQGFVEAKQSGINYRAGQIAPVFSPASPEARPDLFVPQDGVCKLFKNDGRGHFTDVTAASGDLAGKIPGATCAAWAVGPGGKPDLYVGCVGAPNRFFRNAGGGKFVDRSDEIGLSQKVFNTRGILAATLNKNNGVDLILNNEGQESVVLVGKPGGVALRDTERK